MRRLHTLSAVALTLGLVAAACGSDNDAPAAELDAPAAESDAPAAESDAPAAEPGESDDASTDVEPVRLVVGTDAEPTTLDIMAIDDNGLHLSTWSINEPLVDIGNDGEIQLFLAAEVPALDPDDPTRWIVKLVEGVSFTDGAPFNAEAVKANVDRVLDPDYTTTVVGELGGLSGVEVIDDYNLVITTEKPNPGLLVALRKLRFQSPNAFEGVEENPIGTGPYTLVEWQRGQSVTLAANANFAGDPKPTIDEVEIRFIPDTNTRVSAFEAGEIDVLVGPPDTQLAQFDNVVSTGGGEVGASRLDTKAAPFSDVRFRQALNYALDKQTIVDALFGGAFPVSECQVTSPGALGYNDSLTAYPYDPDKAMELLAEVDIPDGFVLDFFGSSAVYGTDREVQEAMASYWNAVGIETNLMFDEIDAYLDNIFNPELGFVYAESDQAFNSFARQIGLFYQRGGPVTAFDEELQTRLDPLVETALTSLDEAEREGAMFELAKIGCDEALFVFNFIRQDVGVIADGIELISSFGQFEKTYWNNVSMS